MEAANAAGSGRVDLDKLLDDFVRLYSGMRQRDARWYEARA
jgi:hypothetical protein